MLFTITISPTSISLKDFAIHISPKILTVPSSKREILLITTAFSPIKESTFDFTYLYLLNIAFNNGFKKYIIKTEIKEKKTVKKKLFLTKNNDNIAVNKDPIEKHIKNRDEVNISKIKKNIENILQ
jgi:hypothetical protein